MAKYKRKEIEGMLETFTKKGDFETAAEFAEEWGEINLAIDYMKESKKLENKNLREIYYQGRSATKDILKDIIYINTHRSEEIPQTFPYANYHFLQKRELDLKKN